MQAAPVALMRASERARRLAEQTGTRFVVRPPATVLNEGHGPAGGIEPDGGGSVSLPPSGSSQYRLSGEQGVECTALDGGFPVEVVDPDR
ncbi:hypothetical protein [uncultured Lamprocystis sp.]|uniref:hypothetical protein n=1 Tax=uncultured Lamprocystis sp. TaxID=543132 RepID=UPI0025FE3CA3|nr:hypothetical protein [uncultured Lamprocystis sp.]